MIPLSKVGMYGVLCTLSEKRLRQIEETPELVPELMSARLDGDVPGLLDLDRTWDALDVLLSDRGKEPLFADAILARSGRSVGPHLGYGKARVLAPARVAEISAALAKLPEDHVRARYTSLRGKTVHGNYGQDPDDGEIDDLTQALERVTALYARAAASGHGMLAAVV